MADAPTAGNSYGILEGQLNVHLSDLEQSFDADAITYEGGIRNGADDLIRDAIEELAADAKKKPRLLVILETTGGSIQVAERIANTFRKHYTEVDFLVPNFAYSAGSILVMSGDSFWMDCYSVLGPIDPQVYKEGVGWVPALGYLHKFEELVKKSAAGTLTNVEAAFACARFDPAELHAFEQAKEQSFTLLKEWLVKYKFKDWVQTQTQGHAVTEDMKKERAKEVADKLNDTTLWHAHSRGIPMQALRDVVNLKVEDFGEDHVRSKVVRAYHKLLSDYMMRRDYDGVVHTRLQFTPHSR